MERENGGLKYRKKGDARWLDLTSLTLPERGAVYEVKAPDGSITLLSRSEAAAPADLQEPPDAEPFNIDFGEGGRDSGPALPAEIPVFNLSELGKGPTECQAGRRVVRPGDVHDPSSFGVLVADRSMEPRYCPGQIAVADTTEKPSDGDFAIVALDGGDCFLRRWQVMRGGRIQLVALDPKVKRMELRPEQVLFAYKVVWVKE